MRMWMVDPKILCRQHLLGEHNEIHKHRHCFVKQYRMEGRKGQIEPRSMKARHDKLVAEMIKREYQHNSPYIQPDVSYLPKMKVNISKALQLLKSRCKECNKRTKTET